MSDPQLFTKTIVLDWSEMDLFGHINNVAYFKFMQSARVKLWEAVGLHDLHREENIGAMVAKSSCEFKAPLFYPDTIRIKSYVSRLGTTSMTIMHELQNGEGEVCALGEDVLVIYDNESPLKCLY